MNRLIETENWLFKRMWWGIVTLVLLLTLSLQALFFWLQHQDNQYQLDSFQSQLYTSKFSDLQTHLKRERDLIEQGLKNQSFNPEQTLERLRDQRFGLEERGYFFVLHLFDIEGGTAFAEHLLLPIAPEEEGVPMDSGLLDEQGFAYREAYLAQLREQGEAEVSYWYRKPGTDYASEKTSYIYLIPELNWVIGAGLYLDDFEYLIQGYHQHQQERLKETAVWLLGLSLLLMVLAILVMRHYNQQSLERLRSLHQQVSDFQTQMVSFSQRLQLDVEKKAKQLDDLDQYDILTKVLNRKRLNQDIQLLSPDEQVLMVNIDGFKEINEIFGNELGDTILCEVAFKLKHRFPYGRVYRLNADVFVVIFSLASEDEGLSETLKDLHYHLVNDRIAEFNDHDVEFNVTVVGVEQCERALSRLEMTMFYAKSKRLNWLAYRPEFDFSKQYRSNLHITHEIRTAIEQDRVHPVFQAIRHVLSGEVTHYECLIRIEQPEGQMMPGDFLEIAQRSKLYPSLMQIMIKKSFAAFKDTPFHFSMNLSYEDILSNDVRQCILNLLTPDIAPRVIFEILESEGIENYAEVSRFIAEIKHFGCKVAIDDFGTGYSNFEHVLKLHVDYIKLDGSLIEGLLDNPEAVYVVESIVYFAKRVGIKVIAEYVSRPELIEKVKELGIDYAQGYAIGYPSKALL